MILFKNKSFWIVLLVLGVFISLGPVSATHTTSIKVVCPNSGDVSDSLTLHATNYVNPKLGASLKVDGKERWFRYISLDIFDEYGNVKYHKKLMTSDWKLAIFNPKFSAWPLGNYKMLFKYDGNKRDKYPPAVKEIQLHLI